MLPFSRRLTVMATLLAVFVFVARAQEASTEIAAPHPEPASATPQDSVTSQNSTAPFRAQPQARTPLAEHRFWDRENAWLFSAVAASRTLDYFSTLNMRRRGVQEALLTNDVVDNHAAFASIEAASTAVSIGASYLFHRYRHHRLERWTSIIHASLATSGAVRNYCLKTAHSSPPP